MRTCIYGGTFNPPHLGHLAAARAAVEELELDQLLLMPNQTPPHKKLPENSATPEQRLEMCRLCEPLVPGCRASDFELQQPGPSYTADTVERYHAAHPEEQLWLLVGTDMVESFHQWRDPARILRYVRLAVVARDEEDRAGIRAAAERLRQAFGAGIDVLNNPPLPMSSTQVRASRDGGLLPAPVAEYIREHRLYRPTLESLRERVRGMVSEKRYRHILGCEETAVELARKYGADVETVAYAAVLHDMTKEFPLEQQLKLAEKWNIILDYEQENLPHLIHADTAAAMAREELGMWEGVCTAIARHTTGDGGMSREDLIVYLADLMEPTRAYPGVEALREAAGRDLREACILATRRTLAFVKSQGREPYYKTARTLEELMKNTSETEEQK